MFSSNGKSFSLSVASGNYSLNKWIDTRTGTVKSQEPTDQTSQKTVAFTPPDTKTDWVLLLRDETYTGVKIPGFDYKNKQGTAALADEKAYRTGQYSLGGRKHSLNNKSLPSGVYVTEKYGVTEKMIIR